MSDTPFEGLEDELRSNRPTLDSERASEISSRIKPASGGSRKLRMMIAMTATIGVFGAMAVFGGVSYAGSSSSHCQYGGTHGHYGSHGHGHSHHWGH